MSLLRKSYAATVPFTDYSNNWSLIDTSKWTAVTNASGGVTFSNGGILVATSPSYNFYVGGTNYLTTAMDIRNFTKFSIGACLHSGTGNIYSEPSCNTTAQLLLTDGGANTIIIAQASMTATSGPYNNRDGYPQGMTSIMGIWHFVNEGGDIRVYHNAQKDLVKATMGLLNINDTGSVMASNTLNATAGWANVYVRLYTTGSGHGPGNSSFVNITVSSVTTGSKFIGSAGTQ